MAATFDESKLFSDTSFDLWDRDICERIGVSEVRERLTSLRESLSPDSDEETLTQYTHLVLDGICVNATGVLENFAIAAPAECRTVAGGLYDFLNNCHQVLDELSRNGSNETAGFIKPQPLARIFSQKIIDFMAAVSVLRDETVEFTGTDWLRIKEQARELQRYIEGEPQELVERFNNSLNK